MTRALLPDLNRAILTLAPLHVAGALAPSSFRELMGAERLTVWDGASDATVYGDARVNHAFRAWHDAAHVAGKFPFSLTGEIATAEYQLAQLREAFPRHPVAWDALIRAEVIGQAEYYAAH